MERNVRYYKCTPLGCVLRLEYVTDKLGNLAYVVTTSNGVHENNHVFFAHLSSAIDYINSNFK